VWIGLTTTKVCTFLVDLSASDIQDPLAQFNHTMPSKDGMMSLAATLNSALETPLDGPTLAAVFEAFWPQFEINFNALLEQFPQEVVVEARSEGSMLEEILESTRALSQRMRAIEDRQIERNTSTMQGIWDGASQALIPENSTESGPGVSASRAAINAALEAARKASKVAGKNQN